MMEIFEVEDVIRKLMVSLSLSLNMLDLYTSFTSMMIWNATISLQTLFVHMPRTLSGSNPAKTILRPQTGKMSA
jgi:hypothetical protein